MMYMVCVCLCETSGSRYLGINTPTKRGTSVGRTNTRSDWVVLDFLLLLHQGKRRGKHKLKPICLLYTCVTISRLPRKYAKLFFNSNLSGKDAYFLAVTYRVYVRPCEAHRSRYTGINTPTQRE